MYNTLMTSPLFGLESARISPETPDPDTSNDFVSSRIAHWVDERIKEKKKAGQIFISDAEIDALIKEAMDLETTK